VGNATPQVSSCQALNRQKEARREGRAKLSVVPMGGKAALLETKLGFDFLRNASVFKDFCQVFRNVASIAGFTIFAKVICRLQKLDFDKFGVAVDWVRHSVILSLTQRMFGRT
jgi:hypothetical protein